jgi:unsaturated chondroitin disaccharide hydrolase
VHEAVFNTASGVFRCPNSQQGYSPFSTWTRGLAWAICGFAEQLEFLRTLTDEQIEIEVLFNGDTAVEGYGEALETLESLCHCRRHVA